MPVARIGHLIALTVLALVTEERGYQRGRDLLEALDTVRREFGR